jgi:hypothetical protein
MNKMTSAELAARMVELEAKIKRNNWTRILADNIKQAAAKQATPGFYRSGGTP